MLKKEIYSLFLSLIDKGLVNPKVIAHDRSLLKAKGQVWHKKDKQKGLRPRKPFDKEGEWGWSETKKEWIYGYGIHLTTIVTPQVPVFPFLAQITPANDKGIQILEENLSKIPKATRQIVADAEYDSQKLYYLSEKRLVSPIRETRNWKTGKKTMSKERKKRKDFFKSKEGQKLYRLRNSTIEQLFNVIKNIFKVEPSWFFGKAYTETLVLTAVYAYQIFVAYSLYHHLPFRRIQRIKPFLDRL